MTIQTIGVGSAANDGTGDPLRTAFQKINSNYTELYGPVFNVEAYGAVRLTESTTAIQNAIDAQAAAGYGIVVLPGVYYISGSLHYYTNTILKGLGGPAPTGAGGSGLVQTSGATAILVPNANRLAGFLFEDFYVYGGSNGSNAGGIDLTGTHDFTLNRVGVSTCGTYNIRMLGGSASGDAGFAHFIDVQNTSVKAGGDAWLLGSSALDQPDTLSFIGCRTNSSGATWIHYSCTGAKTGPGSHVWAGCSFEGTPTSAAILVDAAGAGLNTFHGVRFENTSSGGLTFTLNGLAAAPFGHFDGCTIAPGAGGLTWTDNGPFLSNRIGEYGVSGHILNQFGRAVRQKSVALTSGATPALNADDGNLFTLSITSDIAVTIAVPLNPPAAGFTQRMTVVIRNASGGALTNTPGFNSGANGFKLNGSATKPANGTEVPYDFQWDPVQSFWYEVGTHAAAGL